MKTYQLVREQFLPISINDAWDFFSTPDNLSKITPSDMNFQIITKLGDSTIYPGMKIQYKVSPLFNIPMKWITEIGAVNQPHNFTDMQLKGPYKLWEHTHTFVTVPGGVNMTDEVKYALPLGLLGNIAHAIFVKKRLKDIFNFRKKTLDNYFKNN